MRNEFPLVEALLNDASKIEILWNFDEQQADAVHTHWDFKKAKEEIKELLRIKEEYKKELIQRKIEREIAEDRCAWGKDTCG